MSDERERLSRLVDKRLSYEQLRQETGTIGNLDVVSGQWIESLLGSAGDGPKEVIRSFVASFTDGRGHIYKGVLYLVEEKASEG